MKGEAFVGYSPENHRWSLDGKKVYFEWNPNKEWGQQYLFLANGMKMPQLANPKRLIFQNCVFKKVGTPNLYYYLDKGHFGNMILNTTKNQVVPANRSNYCCNTWRY